MHVFLTETASMFHTVCGLFNSFSVSQTAQIRVNLWAGVILHGRSSLSLTSWPLRWVWGQTQDPLSLVHYSGICRSQRPCSTNRPERFSPGIWQEFYHQRRQIKNSSASEGIEHDGKETYLHTLVFGLCLTSLLLFTSRPFMSKWGRDFVPESQIVWCLVQVALNCCGLLERPNSVSVFFLRSPSEATKTTEATGMIIDEGSRPRVQSSAHCCKNLCTFSL